MIRRGVSGDAPTLASLHAAALPADLLPRLGRDFLLKRFYPFALASPHAFTLAAEQDGEVLGFVMFTQDTPAFMRQLRRLAPFMLVAALTRFPRDLSVLAELARCGLGFRSDTEGLPGAPEACPELFVIAVAQESRGAGVGSALVREGLARLSETQAGASLGCLVKTSSGQAYEFYSRLGFRAAGFEWRGTRAMRVLYRGGDRTLQSAADSAHGP